MAMECSSNMKLFKIPKNNDTGVLNRPTLTRPQRHNWRLILSEHTHSLVLTKDMLNPSKYCTSDIQQALNVQL